MFFMFCSFGLEALLNYQDQDFLLLEMKFSQEEISELDITQVTRPKKEGTDRLYVHPSSEKAANKIFRKKTSRFLIRA